MENRIVIQIVPYIVNDSGFLRALNSKEIEAIGHKNLTFQKVTDSYIESLTILKEKLTQFQEIISET